ncbi:MAG: M24 family metallopeptidase [Candidatus Hodarchaeota archaeon]
MKPFIIPQKRFEERQQQLFSEMEALNLESFVVLSPTNMYWLTGFAMIPTERPFFLIFKKTNINFFVPKLEEQHVLEKVPAVDKVGSYFEYPDVVHPMIHFAKFMKDDLKISSKMGAEGGGARGMWGYRGPKFEDALKMKVAIHPNLISDMRVIKDDDELTCIRECAKWGDRAHELLQEFTATGKNEIEVSFKASFDASQEMRKTLGPEYAPVGWGARPCGAGYRGQIGPWSAIPHSITRGAIFQKGDTLVTGAGGNVAGYGSELERTMFMGEPNEKQRRYFDIMMNSQQAAFDTFAPGVPLSEVDKATKAVFKEAGVIDLVQHHTGHAIGLEGHEHPFLDIGMHDKMEAGMVFTVEPGIYDRSIGGFRHSDTVIITEEGSEIITKYPRELEDLIIDR